MKKKFFITLLAMLVVCAMSLAILSGCVEHKCQDVCPECDGCLTECADPECANKCPGHESTSSHECNDECSECGLCLTDCDDEACSDKCQGHEAESFTVTFVCDEYVTVYVYKTQDMSTEGTQTTTAYSRDSETGALSNDGNGQVNFRLVFADGYKLANIDVTDGYNNLKGSADTGVENGYRITKITDNLTVTITSQLEEAGEDLTQGYKVTFATDEHVSVIVYKTQDMTSGGETTNTAYSRDSGTGTLTKDGEGQVNFILVFDEGYELGSISITPEADVGYKNLKCPGEMGAENAYRITKIADELEVTITTKQINYDDALKINFVLGDHVSVIVYKTQSTQFGEVSLDDVYARDGDHGSLLIDGEGQLNFKIVCDEGYEISLANIVISGEYKQIKDQGDGVYRITKIASDLTITITATAK